MRFYEAMKLLEEGKKVRNTIWPSGSWICKTENGDMTGETNNTFLLANINGNWEEYIESTDNTKIEKLVVDETDINCLGIHSKTILLNIIDRLNKVINKVNIHSTVLLAQEKDIKEIQEELDY